MSVLWAQRRDGPRPARRLRGLATSVFWRSRSLPTRSDRSVTPIANGTHHRPSPVRRWTDAWTAPQGDFAGSAIANAALERADVPGPGDMWEDVSDFALSYDGYAYWDDLPELANRCVQRWTRDRSLPATVDELRGCLFYEQRRWHHFGEDPAGRSAEYMWALVDTLRALVPLAALAPALAGKPRAALAPQAHVRVVSITGGAAPALGPVAAAPPGRHPALAEVPVLRPVTGTYGRLMPVPASEAHVKLVPSADAASRHPDGAAFSRTTTPAAWVRPPLVEMADARTRHPSGHSSAHPSGRGPIAKLRPMPSAEPLPKPPVIVRRSRPASSPADTGAVISPLRAAARSDRPREATRPVTGFQRPEPGRRQTITFRGDDTGYRAWVATHSAGFVLNASRLGGSRPPVVHRAGCASVRIGAKNGGPSTFTPKVCGDLVSDLEAWSAAQGAGQPVACRRCLP